MKVRVHFVLQRQIGKASVRVWALSPDRPGLGWFYDRDYTRVIREELQARPEGEGRGWGELQQYFFGPEFELLPDLDGFFEVSTLDRDFKCQTPPDFGSLKQELFDRTLRSPNQATAQWSA